MKFGIGSVQFGIPYGISNTSGQSTTKEVSSIIGTAQQIGVHLIDTASLYGNSEEVLGECLPHDHKFNIVTKTPRFHSKIITACDVETLEKIFHQSLKKTANEYGIWSYDS